MKKSELEKRVKELELENQFLKGQLQKFENHKSRLREYQKKYQKKNKEKIARRNKEYRIKNNEKIKRYYMENREYLLKRKKEYYRKNIEKIKEYNQRNREHEKQEVNRRLKERRKKDIQYKINNNISRQMRRALQNNKSGYHWENLVGYTIKDLIKHLKKTIPNGYTWNNYLEGKLHIDHIIPISVFNYTKPEHPDFKRCWALENLQLLPAKENIRKSNKLEKPFQPSLKVELEEICT